MTEENNNNEQLKVDKEKISRNLNSNQNIRKDFINREKLLEYGLHFGHKTHLWNPEMKNFIHGEKKGIHIINLNKIVASLIFSYNAIEKIATRGGTFLFVGTNKYSKKTVKENAIRTGSFYVNERWLGGTLTNLKTIQKSVKKLLYLERLEKNDFSGYTKKEGLKLKKELDKLRKNLEGIKYMRRKPSAIIVTSVIDELIAIKEAAKMDIPVFGIVDTNANPRLVRFPIFANDDGNKSVSLIMTFLADAIASAKGEQKLVAGVPDDQIKVLGITENSNYVKKHYNQGNKYNKNRDYNENRKSNYNKKTNNEIDNKKDNKDNNNNNQSSNLNSQENNINNKTNDINLSKRSDSVTLISDENSNQLATNDIKNKIITLQNIDQDKMSIEVISIKGVGKKFSEYLNSKNIYLIKDILNVLKNDNQLDEVIKDLPNLKDLDKKIQKFDNFIEATISFIN